MATMPPTRCTHPGCAELCPSGTSRCPAHRTRAPSAHTRYLEAHPEHRTPWRRLRARVLAEHPQCQAMSPPPPGQPPTPCHRPATEVDHIRPIALGGAFLDPSNLQALCAEHHEIKTELDRRAIRAAKQPATRPRRGQRRKRLARPPRDAVWFDPSS